VIGGAAAITNPDAARFFPIASPPPTFEAYEEYKEGLQLQARGQVAEAVNHFRWAAVLDTSFTFALIDAAMASMNRGKVAQTDSILEVLRHAGDRLTPFQRHLMAYMVATRADDWPGAFRALSRVVDLAPERYAYRYAISASHVNRPREVVATLSRPGLDTLYRNSTLFYWNVLTLAHHQLGAHENELAAARRARAYRPGSAGALTQEIRALAGLGRPDAVLARLDTLLSLPREGWFTPAWAMETAARELRAHGHFEASTEALNRAVAWHRRRPADETATEPRRAQLADVFYLLGNLDEAERLFSMLAAGDTTSAVYLGSLGAIAARRGHRTEAEAIALRLKGLEHFVPLPGNDAIVARARIAALLGDRDRAMGLLTEAFGPAGTDMLHQDIDFEGMRDDPRFREFIRPKG
jgi:tetratricopeptide (TPR) repeat protein